MKTKLQLKNSMGIMILLLFIFPLFQLSAQVPGNVITGGTMEADDEDSWTIEIGYRDDLNDTPEYEFGNDNGCTNCVGNGLEVWAAGAGYTNIIIYQEVTLKAGHTYYPDAAIKNLDVQAQNNWIQLKIGLEAYPANENDGIKLYGTNAWLGCGVPEGMMSEVACDGDLLMDSIGDRAWIAPDTLGDEFTAYFAIVAGMWTNADNQYPYDFIIDEVVLIDSAEAAASGLNLADVVNKASVSNFPNPYRNQTTIVYELPTKADVKLSLYNMMGQEVMNLYEGARDAGTYRAEVDLSNINTNVLFCKLEYNNKVVVTKMTRY